ncbi:MAG: hypothetical protein WD673_06575 [Alphaproteobacteria bacterium]
MSRNLALALIACLAVAGAAVAQEQGQGQGTGQEGAGQGGGQGGGWLSEGECAEEDGAIQVRLVVDGALAWKQGALDVVGLPDSVAIEEGQQEGLRALPVAALVPPAAERGRMSLVACDGGVQTLPIAELRRAPGIWWLTSTRRGFLKLVRMEGGHEGLPVLRDVRLIEIRG